MELPKYLTTVTPLSKYLSFVLFILLPFLGFYAGTRYQSCMFVKEDAIIEKGIKQNTSKGIVTVTPTSAVGKKQTEIISVTDNPKIYIAGGKYINGKKYSVAVLPGWNIKHEWSDVSYYDDLYILNAKDNSYQIRISQGARSSTECIYTNEPEEGNKPYTYHTFVDLIDTDGNKYRREDYFKNGSDVMGNDNLLCQLNPRENKYGSSSSYGNIWYIFPIDEFGKPKKDLDKDLIRQMDTMIRSLKELKEQQ